MRYEDNSQAGGIAQGQAPDARDDMDALTAGTKTPAEGNVISGEGTKFGAMSSDQAEGAHVTKLAGAGGTDSSPSNGKLAVSGEFGHLTMDAQGNYHYMPKANVPEDSKDVFTYTLADGSGRLDTANLTIEFGKTPPAVRADAQQVVPGPDGVVVLPEGVQLSDIVVVGRNLVVNLPDGTQMVIVDGAVFVPQLVLGGIEVPPTNLASLLIDAEPQPAAGTTPPSSGGNFGVPVAPLDPGVPLGDLLPPTEMSYTPPEVREEFPEEPNDDPSIIIDPGNGVAVVNAVDQVSEAGLPTRNEGEPAGSGEGADGNGADNDDPGEATTGSIIYDAPDGVQSITITGADGLPVDAVVGAVIVGLHGTMTITSVVNGVISYNYVLSDNTSGDGTHDDFSVTIVDSDGDSATATLQVNIVDDNPNAVNDTDSIGAGQFGPATGNVITDAAPGDAGDGDNGADTVGADDAQVSAVSGAGGSDNSFNENGELVVEGQYGTLTIDADGNYEYVRHAGTPGGVSDVFTYTLTDGDGDSDTATLTIDIGDETPTIEVEDLTPNAEGSDNQVFEAGLDGPPNGEAPGSNAGGNSETTSGTFTVGGGDGGLSIFINGSSEPIAVGSVIATANGTLTITDITNGVVSYSYTLGDNTTDGPAAETDVFSLVVRDADGSSAAATLTIDIVDDVPTARDDSASQAGENDPITVDVLANDTRGADGVDVDNNPAVRVEMVAGTLSGAGSVVYNNDGTFTYTPAPGEEGTVTFDYRIVDGDGDTSIATVTITLGEDSTPTISAEGGTSVNEAGLPARGDESEGSGEEAAAGANGDPSETATGTLTLTSGGDTVGSLVILDGNGNPVDVTNGGVVHGVHGDLTVTGNPEDGYSYSYTLLDNTSGEGQHDDFAMTVTDSDGDTASTTLVIDIVDDAPTARDDSDSLGAGQFGPATGNVITDADAGDAGDSDNGADTQGADGAEVASVTGAEGSDDSADGNGDFVVQGQYGVLTINQDGSYSYIRDPGTPGGVSDSFTYVIRDGDGDTSSASLVITIDDSMPELAAPRPVLLDDDALAGGNAGGAGDNVDSQGTPGQLIVSGGDAGYDYFFSGTNNLPGGFTSNLVDPATLQVLQGGVVVLTITLNNETGAYSVVQNNPIDHAAGQGENNILMGIGVYVQDADGDTASATLNINVDDDTPLANDDTDVVAAGGDSASGNVLSGAGTVEGAANADSPGADGFNGIVGLAGAVSSDANAAGGFTAQGTYGSLQMAADGTYTYTRSPGTPGDVSDVFTYTYVDGDGDTISATLTIDIGNDTPTIEVEDLTPNAEGNENQVFEAGLDGPPNGEAPGSDAGGNSETTTGTFTVGGGDGALSVYVNGSSQPIAAGSVITTALGTLTITDITNGVVSYSYTLGDNTTDGPGAETDVFSLVVRDSDGSSAAASLTIDIVDDVPTARDDSASQGGENDPVTVNVIANDTRGADGVDIDNAPAVRVEAVDGTLSGAGSLVYNNDGTFTYTPVAGETGTVTFDYRIIDGDGDTSVATVTITLDRDSTPVAVAEQAYLDDDGLPGANGAGSGDIDANQGEAAPVNPSEAVYHGQLEANGGGDTIVGYSLQGMHGTSGTVGTESVSYSWDAGSGTLTATITSGARAGTELFQIELDTATGEYDLTLLDNVLHPAGDNEQSVSTNLSFTAEDSDGDTGTGTFTITFNDDVPSAVNETASVETQSIDFNTAFVLDFSSSINNNELHTMLDGVRAAVSQLFDSTSGDVSVRFVLFASSALSSDAFTSEAQAIAYLNSIDPQAGGVRPITNGTNFTAAIEELLSVYSGDSTANNQVFFLSDGNANQQVGSDGALSNAVSAQWNAFVNGDPTINVTAIGVGNGISSGPLDAIDVNPDPNGSPILLNDFSDVLAALTALTAPPSISGDLDANDRYGADGPGGIASFTLDGVTYTYNGSSIDPSNGAPDVAGSSITVTTAIGGSFTLNFATGAWTYTPPGAIGSPTSETVNYTIVDADGDPSSASLVINVNPDSTPTTTGATAWVDDDGLSGGNSASTTGDHVGPAPESQASGNLGINWGPDGVGSISFAQLQGQSATIGQETVTYQWNSATNTLSAVVSSGARSGITLFRVVVDPANGDYSVQLLDNILHSAGSNENDASVALTYRVSDGDGSATTGTLNLNFDDDAPTIGSIQNQTVNNDPGQAPAVGTLHFAAGADGVASSMTITASTAGITAGNYNLVTNQVGNVLTAYTDVNGNGTYEAGTDSTAVFRITVDPAAGSSGTYTFDLLAALDPVITPFNVQNNGSFGSGPSQSVVVTNSVGDDIVFVTGWSANGGFTTSEISAWKTGASPDLTQTSNVNGSSQGWGLGNNNFNAGEFMRFDFGTLNDYDGGGAYTPPAGEYAHVSYADFTFFQFGGSEKIIFVAHYTNGTTQAIEILGSQGLSHYQINAPAGAEIAWIDVYMSSGDIKLNLGNVGIITQDIDETINVTVTLGDGDGDSVSGGFTVNVADGNTPAGPSLARVLGVKIPVESTTATNTGIAAGAAAAVGMAALPLAADQQPIAAAEGHGGPVQSPASGGGSAAGAGAHGHGSLSPAFDGHALRVDAAGVEPSSLRAAADLGHDANLAGANASPAPVAKDTGPQVQVDHGPAEVPAVSHAAPVVNMPSAEALQAAGLGGNAASPEAVGQVVAEALGLHDAPTVDGLLAHLGAVPDAAAPTHASAGSDLVQGWDMGGQAAFAGHADMLMNVHAMLAVHHDAVQPTANG